jgi:hypothetical protein
MTFFDIDNRSVRSHRIERSVPFLLEFPVQDAPGGCIVRGNMMATRSAETGKSR